MNFITESSFDSKKIGKLVGTAAAIGVTGKCAYNWWENRKEAQHLGNVRNQKRTERDNQVQSLQEEYKYVSADPNLAEKYSKITTMGVKNLQEKLFKRELLAEDAVKACIWRSLQIQLEYNCIIEFLPDALEKARELDSMHMVKGPLHGIPFCVKDDARIKGIESTLGCSKLIGKPSTETAVLVQCLEALGAIPFCRTNTPQTCISLGSENPIFGKTLNPIEKRVGPGGSSSGSGCLVAAGGCPFGTGSDTGGSLRVPAHFCGISTLKATSNRISRRGCIKCVDLLPATPGIFTKHAGDNALIFQALTENGLQSKMDPFVPPIPWNETIFSSKQKLQIGYISELEIFPGIGDSAQVVQRAKTFLESMGHVLVPFQPPVETITFVTFPIDTDMKARFQRLVGNDQISPSIRDIYDAFQGGFGLSLEGKHFLGLREEKKDELPSREELSHKFLDKMNQEGVDALISLVMPFPALDMESVPMFEDILAYTIMWNILDFPAGVVKFWRESGLNWKESLGKLDKSEAWKTALLNHSERVSGLPIGIQVIGRPYQEEVVLRLMTQLDDINE